jgi:Rieske Fe-S protein
LTERLNKNADETEEQEAPSSPSRRAFLKFLMGTSILLSFLPFTPMTEFFYVKPNNPNSSRKKIANRRDLPEGSSMVFFFPGEEDKDRSIITHLPAEYQSTAIEEGKDEFIKEGFVAFNTICPHLQCPVELPDDDAIVCPCHGGFFDVRDGSVLGGPSPRPLPAIKLEVDQSTGDIYAVELVGKIGYGRE